MSERGTVPKFLLGSIVGREDGQTGEVTKVEVDETGGLHYTADFDGAKETYPENELTEVRL